MRFDLFAVLLLFGGQAGATPIPSQEGPRRSVDDEAAAVLAGRWVCSALLALARGS
jgi:hypothetical protein